MKRSRFVSLAMAIATVVAPAVCAATASPAGRPHRRPRIPTGVMRVGFAVQKFVKRGKTLGGDGSDDQHHHHRPRHAHILDAVHRNGGEEGGSPGKRPHNAAGVEDLQRAQPEPRPAPSRAARVDHRPEPGGAHNITADSNGGLLGSLLCGLLGGSAASSVRRPTPQTHQGRQVKRPLRGTGSEPPVNTVSTSGGSVGTQAVSAVCTVLDLTLGPLDTSTC